MLFVHLLYKVNSVAKCYCQYAQQKFYMINVLFGKLKREFS